MAGKPSPLKEIWDGMDKSIKAVAGFVIFGLLVFIYWEFKKGMP